MLFQLERRSESRPYSGQRLGLSRSWRYPFGVREQGVRPWRAQIGRKIEYSPLGARRTPGDEMWL